VSATEIDHLVIAAHDLAQGVRWCEQTLGVTPGPGGRHPLMSTHNRLLKLDAGPAHPRAYLEIIAIDPEAPPPGRARWFGLDDAALQARLREAPRLVHWVAGTRRLDALRAALQAAGAEVGEPVQANRETPAGLLQWRITVRADGTPACRGALPTLIEWPGRHPADAMPASGITLESLMLRGLAPAAMEALQAPGVAFAEGGGAAVEAVLRTPRGTVQLSSP